MRPGTNRANQGGPDLTAATRTATWRVRDRVLDTRRGTLLMGVVNVTPDSFSDGGRFADTTAAVAHGLDLWEAGADLVDVGGESTRPGADPVPAAVEIARVVPVVGALAERGVVVSVDTAKSTVAAAALAAGAAAINDVTALADPEMATVVVESGAGVVLMHMQGTPRTMQTDPRYNDVVGEVTGFLRERAEVAQAAGIDPESICVDPGIGFGKRLEHNLALLHGLPALAATGYPVLVGTSRKSFLTALVGDLDAADRDVATAASLALAIAGGAAVLRVHNVVMAAQIARVADAIVRRAVPADDTEH